MPSTVELCFRAQGNRMVFFDDSLCSQIKNKKINILSISLDRPVCHKRKKRETIRVLKITSVDDSGCLVSRKREINYQSVLSLVECSS